MKRRNQRYKIRVFIILMLVLGSVIGNQCSLAKETTKKGGFSLTEDEKQYLDTIRKDKITFGTTNPEEYSNNQGNESMGSAIPVIHFMENILELNITRVQGDWPVMYDNLQEQKVDFLYHVSINEGNSSKVYLASPIATSTVVLISGEASDRIKNIEDIQVGMIKDASTEYYCLPYLQLAKRISYYDNLNQLLTALNKREIDAALTLEDNKSQIYEYDQLSIVRTFPQIQIDYTIGTCNKKYLPLIRIFNRYMEMEGDNLRKHVNQENERYQREYFYQKEQKTIKAIEKEYSHIDYFAGIGMDYPVSYEQNQVKCGIVPDMISFFERITGIAFNENSNILQEEEANEALISNEIQLASGIRISQESLEEYSFSDAIYQSQYILAVKSKEKKINNSDLNQYYWGIMEQDMPLFQNSIFDGHLISFLTKQEMLAGLEEKQVKGIITNQSVIDYNHIIDNGNKYNSILELSIPSSEYLAYNKENQELNELINKLIRYYQIQYPDYKEKFGNTIQAYEEGIQKTHTSQARWKYSLILVLAVVFLMLGTAYGYYLFRKLQQQKELEHNISQLLQNKENDSSALQEDDRGDYTIHEGKDSISYEDQKIQQKFDYDPLTGLVNQRAYIERICNVVERNPEEMGAFAFINLDQFKIINDIWGHMVGDEILKVFAESVRQLVKNQDTIVFRISGDGFGAFRGNIQNEQQLEVFCEELEQLTAVIQVDGESIERSYSCGVSLYNKHTVEMKKLIEHAEEALKQCKLGTQKVVIWNEYI